MRPVPPLKTPRGAGPPLLPLSRTAGTVALSALPATVAQSGALTPQRINTRSLWVRATTYVGTGASRVARVQSVTVPAGAVTMTIECMSGGPSGFYAVRQRIPVRRGDVISASAGAPSYDDGFGNWFNFTASSVTVNGRVVCRTPAGPSAGTALVISDPSGAESYQARRPIAGLSMAAAAPGLFVSGAVYDYADGGCVAITFEG